MPYFACFDGSWASNRNGKKNELPFLAKRVRLVAPCRMSVTFLKLRPEYQLSTPPAITIREATLTDLPCIVRMLADDVLGRARESFEEPLPSSYQEAFEEIDASDANVLLVAELEGRVVAVFQITFIPYLTFRGGKRALIEGVRVDAEHRSQGIGKLMISEAICRATEKGCHLIQLTTDKTRPEAKKFYESLGFVASHEGLKLTVQS